METNMAEKQAKSWANTGRRSGEKSWSSELELFNFNDHADKYVRVRLVTGALAEKVHWPYLNVEDAEKHARGAKLNIKTSRSFPAICPDFDPNTETGTPKTCPVCLHFDRYMRTGLNYYCYAYVGIPGKKDKSTVRWLDEPVVLKISTAVLIGIQNVINLKGGADPADTKEGYYINIMKKSKPSGPNDYYVVMVGESMPLTKAQRLAVKELPDLFELYKPASAANIKESLSQKGYYKLLDSSELEDADSDDDDDDEDERPSKKNKKDKKSKKSSKHDDDDDDDSDSDEDEDDDDSDDRSSKKGKKSSKHNDDDDDDEDEDSDSDEDEDSDEDDDDDDDIPAPKSSSKGSKNKKSSKHNDDDEDEDEDDEDSDNEDEDDDDDDDIPAPKSSSKGKKSSVKDKKSKLKLRK